MIRTFIRDNRRYAARQITTRNRSPPRPGKSYNAAEQQNLPQTISLLSGKIDFTIQLVEKSVQCWRFRSGLKRLLDHSVRSFHSPLCNRKIDSLADFRFMANLNITAHSTATSRCLVPIRILWTIFRMLYLFSSDQRGRDN